jgi:hypothetical protein
MKNEYIQYCSVTEDVPLFFRPAWLDAAAIPWYVLYAKIDTYAAFWVYHHEDKYGFHFIRNPHLTPYTGLLLLQNEVPASIQHQLISKLIAQLPKFDVCALDLSFTIDPHWNEKKIEGTHRITNILQLEEQDLIYKTFKPALKRQIKKAEKNLRVEIKDDIHSLYKLHSKTFEKQQSKPNIPESVFVTYWELCKKTESGKVFFAIDESNNFHAALWLVYDKTTAYYLAGGTDSLYYGSGAMSLLMWHAIKKVYRNKKSISILKEVCYHL